MGHLLLVVAWIGATAWPVALFLFWGRLWRGRIARVAVALVSIAWFFGVWAFLVEPQTLVVRHVSVQSAQWRGAPLRIGLISDTHAGAPHMDGARMARVVGAMNAARPDIVLLLGDYAGDHEPAELRSQPQRAAVLAGIPPFADLKAPLGVVAVLGNHDWWYDGPALEQALTAAGATVLENDAVRIARDGGAFWIAGLADLESRRAQPSYADALARVPETDPVIAISHWPDVFADAPARVALTAAGHSHCGQVNFPLFGRLMHASHGSARWPCGLYTERGTALYVTGGVGVSILPVRFNQPPEIVVLMLASVE